MRILNITATYPPSKNGVAIVVSGTKIELEKLGNEVIVLAPENKKYIGSEKGIIRYPSIPNPMIVDYPIPLFPDLKMIIKLIKGNKPDIVHTHHPFHVGYFARLIANYYKVPLVFTFHTRYDTYSQDYLNFLPNDLKKMFIQNNVNEFCKKTDLVISPCNSIAESLSREIPEINVATIPTGISEIPRDKSTESEIKKKLNIPEDKKVLLTVARLSKEKNLPLLINSLDLLDDSYILVLVGGGPFENELKQLAKENGSIDKIRFVGAVEHLSLGTYYQVADVLVHASVTETQGLTFLEAFSFGLPIVAVRSDAAQTWVTNECGLLTDNTYQDLARGILEITKLDRAGISEKTKNLVSQFSADKTAKLIQSEYEILIDQFKLGNKLLKTGWQSWTPREKNFWRFPVWNYPPTKDDYLPVIDSVSPLKDPVKGWCSWYAYGRKITENKILDQAKWFANHKELPINYILVDGGWSKIGDWGYEDKTKFPRGLEFLHNEIEKLGFKGGIWIAPFLVEPSSGLFRIHKDWVVNIGGFYVDGLKSLPFVDIFVHRYILDLRKSEVENYIFDCLDNLLVKCNFELIKLDFLYSIYFIPGISPGEASMILRNFLAKVKKRYPNVYTIACGAPLKPCVGVVDSMRIGPDTISPELEKLPILKRLFNTYKVGLVIKNVKRRLWTKDFWNLDPDVFVCRQSLGVSDKKILDLRRSVESANGNLFLGDDMTSMSKERIDTFILPLFNKNKA